ncbi:lytic murein transglycosylase [Insolitispirillum peregrinum]
MVSYQSVSKKCSVIGSTCVAALMVFGCASSATTTNAAKATPPAPQTQATTAPSTAAAPTSDSVTIDPADFRRWLDGVRSDALAQGISARTLDRALPGIQPQPRVLELDRRQPEFTQTFGSYLQKTVSARRIADGKAMLVKHQALLGPIEAQYGVQARFLLAFWGMETNYGSNFGGFPVLGSLATLAYDQRRPAFFRRELMAALAIVDAGDIPADKMVGSWAGAMGNLQFMPSTFRAHAVDRDGDGRRDIWGSLPDTFASAAKYLSDEGWKRGQGWGREVILPTGFSYEQADLSIRKPVSEWLAQGVRPAGASALPVSESGLQASIVVPAGARGPAFMVYDNFRVIMVWNKSVLYALGVSYLADQMVGGAGLVVQPPADDVPLRRSDITEMQTLLARLGYDPGPADGMAGGQTRSALKAFQTRQGLIADAYPSQEVLSRLRSVAQ